MTARSSGNGRRSGPGQPSLIPADVPAHDIEAEKSVLGALVLLGEPKMVLKVANRVSAEDFYWEFHQLAFAAALALARRGAGTDTITLRHQLETNGLKISDEILSRIDEFAGWVPAAGNVAVYADRVRKLSQWRYRRTTALMMLDAVRNLDDGRWEKAVAPFLPTPVAAPASTGPQTLRLVSEGGEVVGQVEKPCEGCVDLGDQLKGANSDIAKWRTKFYNLERSEEERARADGMWQTAQRLFEHWKKQTGHKRSQFTGSRFWECEPYLRNRKYGPEMIERAIDGMALDPGYAKKPRANGTRMKYDKWGYLFSTTDWFEEYVNRAPLNWTSSLNIVTESDDSDRARAEPRLTLAIDAAAATGGG